jgi:hypothetical protein
MTKTITVLINDNDNGTCNPLIYSVEVDNPADRDEVLKAVTIMRQLDLGDDEEELDLELIMAFEGDLNPISDWRE